MQALAIAFGAALGAVIGSFLNVVRHRVPRHQSVVRPPSHCPSCGTELRARELVPLGSWLWQRGRCRTCGAGISVVYPLIELAGAIVGGGIAWFLVR
jgi:leader peptidase (prepilin peptidase)/N-methyltransferase